MGAECFVRRDQAETNETTNNDNEIHITRNNVSIVYMAESITSCQSNILKTKQDIWEGGMSHHAGSCGFVV